MKWTHVFYVLPVFLGISFSAHSLNADFMNDTATQQFNKQDWDMFKAAADKALDTLPAGKKAVWNNPDTGNHGYLEPLSKSTKNGMVCRHLKIVNHSKHIQSSDKYVFLFCKHKEGWKVS